MKDIIEELAREVSFEVSGRVEGDTLNYIYTGKYKGESALLKVFNPRMYLTEERFSNELRAYQSKRLPSPRLLSYGRYNVYDYIIAELVEGITLREAEYSDRPINIPSIVEQILLVHNQEPKTATLEEYYATFSDTLTDCFRRIENSAGFIRDTDFGMIFEVLKSHYNKLIEDAKGYEAEVKLGYVHGDFNNSNVLLDLNGNCLAFVDWEFSNIGSPYVDIAHMTNIDDDFSSAYSDEIVHEFRACRPPVGAKRR